MEFIYWGLEEEDGVEPAEKEFLVPQAACENGNISAP